MNNLNYKVGLYCRLSLDDGSSNESGSITTQKMILEKYCKDNNISIYDYYIDDGFSGLNFNRPSFQRLLNDISSNKINMVITKDLSRLGRDYIMTGYYTEVFFPSKKVRYIAINDAIDTLYDNNDIAPFKNILNDMYAKDLSRKVKAAKRQRALNGLYISAQVPYGYIKDPTNYNHLIIDENVCDVVKKIYKLYISGLGITEIAKTLEKEKILTPSSYKAKNGDTRFERYKLITGNPYRWIPETINSILRNRIYIGDIENFKYEVINYKTKQRVKVDKDRHVIIKNTHEAIITEDEYNQVQDMMKTKCYPSYIKHENIFKSVLYCMGCGRRLQIAYHPLKDGSRSAYYKCAHHFKHKDECTESNTIYYNVIKEIITLKIRELFNKILNNPNIITQISSTISLKLKDNKDLKDKEKIDSRLSFLTKIIKNLYEDKIQDKIDVDTYNRLLNEYTEEKKELLEKIKILEEKEINIKNIKYNFKQFEERIKSLINEYNSDNFVLTKDIITKLISRIEVGYKKKVLNKTTREIRIIYKFIEMEI